MKVRWLFVSRPAGRRGWPPVAAAMLAFLSIAFAPSAPAQTAASEAPPPLPTPSPLRVWPQETIAEAKAVCAPLLASRRYDAREAAPLKNGPCGAPAPLLLKGFRSTPPVAVSPAATVTCPLAEALNRWLETVVQPAAKELLQKQVVTVMVVDSYNCRRRYGDPTQKLSNHATAMAIDVAGFELDTTEQLTLENHWTPTDPTSAFFHRILQNGCGIFSTALGPDANASHRAHFHLDVQPRKQPLCQ